MFFLQVHTAALGLARQRSGEEWRFGATFLSLEGNDDWSRGAHYIPWLEPGHTQTSIYSGCFFLKHLHFCCLNVWNKSLEQCIETGPKNPKEGDRWYIDICLIHIYFYIYIHDIDILYIYISLSIYLDIDMLYYIICVLYLFIPLTLVGLYCSIFWGLL